jgi:hypothetical protein
MMTHENTKKIPTTMANLNSPDDRAEGSMAILNEDMKNMPKHIRNFCKGLKSLYAELDVTEQQLTRQSRCHSAYAGSDSIADCNDRLFREKNALGNYVVVFAEKILPGAYRIVMNMKAYVETFIVLEYEDWVKYLPESIQLLSSYTDQSELLVKLNERLMESLKTPLDKLHEEQKRAKKLKESGWIPSFPFPGANAEGSGSIPQLRSTLQQISECFWSLSKSFAKAKDMGNSLANSAGNTSPMHVFKKMGKSAAKIKNNCDIFIGTAGEVSKPCNTV